jgi:hypothetical protein
VVVVVAVALVLFGDRARDEGRGPGMVVSLTPRIAVPGAIRDRFVVTVPARVGAWMLSSLLLSLLPAVLRTVFGVQSPLVSGFAAFVAPGLGG